jgi:hypothetical protein
LKNLRTKVKKNWELNRGTNFQKSGNKIFKNLGTKITKIRELKLKNPGTKNKKNLETKITKI